jgi:hypothetical protein
MNVHRRIVNSHPLITRVRLLINLRLFLWTRPPKMTFLSAVRPSLPLNLKL